MSVFPNQSQATLEMNSALSAKLELEAKLGSIADERKALLERCLAAESELDRDQLYKISLPGKSILGDYFQENSTY